MNTERCKILAGATSPIISESHITIRLPLLSIHPYNNYHMYQVYQSKYSSLLPLTDTKHHCHSCNRIKIHLPYASNYLESQIFVEVYNNLLNSDFIRRLDRFIVNGSFSNSTKYAEKYMIIMAVSELYLKTSSVKVNWIANYCNDFISENRFEPPYAQIFYQLYTCHTVPPMLRDYDRWLLPPDFNCICFQPVAILGDECLVIDSDNDLPNSDLEETSLTDMISNMGKAIGSSIATTYYAYKAADFDITEVQNDLLADLTLLATNFNVYTIVWAFIKLINKIVKLPNLFKIIIDLFKDTYAFIISKISGTSPQQHSEGLEATALEQENISTLEKELGDINIVPPVVTQSQFSKFLDKLKQTLPITCSILATILVILTAVLMGKNSYDDKSMANKSQSKRVAEAFYNVARTGVSIKNIFKILTEFPGWIKDTAFNYLLDKDGGHISRLLSKIEVMTPEGLSKADFFEKLEFVGNPANLPAVSRSEKSRAELIWCDRVLEAMAKEIAEEPSSSTKSSTQQWLFTKLQHTRSSIMTIGKMPPSCGTRFVPFWVNIIGPSGSGKSTIAPHILSRLKEFLKHWEEHDAAERIPEDEGDWCYSMNFCDKYLTNYHGQYSVVIDDLFQDASVIGDATPSALLLIQMVSSQPFYTVQAAVEDKGTPFTSKFILTTSNDYQMNRKEIIDRDALVRRMNVRIEVVPDLLAKPGEQLDPYLEKLGMPQQVVYNVVDQQTRAVLHRYRFEQLCLYIFDLYCQWYKLQQKILNSGTTALNVNGMIDSIKKGGFIPEVERNKYQLGASSITKCHYTEPKKVLTPTTVAVLEESQSIKCMLGRPSIKTIPSTYQVPFDQLSRYYPLCKRLQDQECSCYLCTNSPLMHCTVEQYDCDCDSCITTNKNYRTHCDMSRGTLAFIPSISEFRRYEVTCEDPIINKYKQLFSSFWDIIKNIFSKASKHPLAIVVAVIGTCSVLWYSRTGSDYLEDSTLAYSSGPNRSLATRIKIQHQTPIRLAQTDLCSEENSLRDVIPNQNTYDLVTRIFYKESICVLRYECGGKTRYNTATRIIGTCLLTNHHFMQHLVDGQEFEVIIYHRTIGQQIRKQIFNPKRYVRLGNLDAGVYQCDNHVPHAASLINHFVENSVPDGPQYCVVVSILDPDRLICPVLIPGVKADPHTKNSVYGSFSALDTYSTDLPVKKGQSGSLLISTEPSIKNKILGIQVCRDTKTDRGYFKPITKQMLEEAINNFDLEENLCDSFEEDLVETSAINLIPTTEEVEYQSLKYLGHIPKEKRVSQPVYSKYLPSLIQDKETLEFEPAVLYNKDVRMDAQFIGRSLVFRALKGYDDNIGCVNTQELSIAVEELSVDLCNTMNLPMGCKKVLLSEFQMVNGEKPYLKKIDMRTSPGYPYIKQKGAKDLGKFKWFNEIGNENNNGLKQYEMSTYLKQKVCLREEKARQGIKIPTIAYACLKDEVRPKAKIINGQTRIFQCLPMDYNLLIRKYFGAFVIAQHYNAARLSSCVGVDPAKHWYMLRARLEEKAFEWEDFDYKNWDQHLHPELVMSVADIVSYWYGDVKGSPNFKVRRVLLYDLVYTTLMVKDHLFVKSTGQCSGCSITAELNCIVHDLLMYYVFRLICKDLKVNCDIKIYRQNVACAIYGDDIVLSVTSDWVQSFNGNTIKPHIERLGMTITPGDKESTIFQHKKPQNTIFLKRNFTIGTDNPDFMELDASNSRAPLQREIIDNIWQWASKADDLFKPTEQNCETALREYFMFGKQVFNQQKTAINQRIAKFNESSDKKLNLISLSYDNLLSEYEGGSFISFGQQENAVAFDCFD